MTIRSLYGPVAIMALAALSACSRSTTSASTAIPHLQKQGTATQLIVDGKPFLMVAGELRNSSGSTLDFSKPMWPRLAAMHLNTVLTAIYWELIGTQRGPVRFLPGGRRDPGCAKKQSAAGLPVVRKLEERRLQLSPAWVKTNQNRFPRVQDKRRQEHRDPLHIERGEPRCR